MGDVTTVPMSPVLLSFLHCLLSERLLQSKVQPPSKEDFPIFPASRTIFPFHVSFHFRKKRMKDFMLLESHFGCLKLQILGEIEALYT